MRRWWILFRRLLTQTSEALKQSRLEHRLLNKRVTLLPGCKITGLDRVAFGQDILISHETFIQGAGGVTFGDRIMIGPRVMLISTGHDLSSRTSESRPIVLEDDVWIGAGAIVLPGVRLGSGSIVGAGAVVTKDTPPNSVVAGTPARLLKTITREGGDSYFSSNEWLRQFGGQRA